MASAMKKRPIRSITLPITATERETWFAAARSEGLEIHAWLRAAAELAIARGSTR